MRHVPAGFFPNEWNQTFGAFDRLVEQLAEMQVTLVECGELTPENCDVAYIREQVTSEVDTLQFMADDAEKHWKTLGVAIASAIGRLNLQRPADDVAWCASILNAAWNLHNGLRRELSGESAELCVQRLSLHLARIPDDIDQWRGKITAEIRAGGLCKQTPGERPVENEWTPEEETEARRLIAARTVTTAAALRDKLSIRQSASQSLFRHVTGKQKKQHKTD